MILLLTPPPTICTMLIPNQQTECSWKLHSAVLLAHRACKCFNLQHDGTSTGWQKKTPLPSGLRRTRKPGNCHGNDQGRRLTDQEGIQNNERRFRVVRHIIKERTFRQKSIAKHKKMEQARLYLYMHWTAKKTMNTKYRYMPTVMKTS